MAESEKHKIKVSVSSVSFSLYYKGGALSLHLPDRTVTAMFSHGREQPAPSNAFISTE